MEGSEWTDHGGRILGGNIGPTYQVNDFTVGRNYELGGQMCVGRVRVGWSTFNNIHTFHLLSLMSCRCTKPRSPIGRLA